MENTYQTEMDELAISLTRPATKLGVPFKAFFLSIMGCFFGWVFYQQISGETGVLSILVFMLIWCMSYVAMFLITSKDIFGLVIYWVNFQHFSSLQSNSRWGNTDAYQP